MKQNRVLTQVLKPFSIQTLYGTVETVPHKDFLVATQALQPVGLVGLGRACCNQNPQAEACATVALSAHTCYRPQM